jgi:hypothetical protein
LIRDFEHRACRNNKWRCRSASNQLADSHFDKWVQARGWLTAFDAASGKMKWRYAASKPILGAVTATAGDVVLTGELNGDLVALHGKSGKVLFRGDVGGPITGGVALNEIKKTDNARRAARRATREAPSNPARGAI